MTEPLRVIQWGTGNVGHEALRAVIEEVVGAETLLTSARNLLGQGAVPPPVDEVAAEKIEAADALLDEALAVLTP